MRMSVNTPTTPVNYIHLMLLSLPRINLQQSDGNKKIVVIESSCEPCKWHLPFQSTVYLLTDYVNHQLHSKQHLLIRKMHLENFDMRRKRREVLVVVHHVVYNRLLCFQQNHHQTWHITANVHVFLF